MLPDLGYEALKISLGPGDLIAIFSDGVTEAENPEGEEFGEDRLAEMLAQHREASAEEAVERVLDSVTEFTRSAPAADDVTLVVARMVGG